MSFSRANDLQEDLPAATRPPISSGGYNLPRLGLMDMARDLISMEITAALRGAAAVPAPIVLHRVVADGASTPPDFNLVASPSQLSLWRGTHATPKVPLQ